MGSCSWCRAGGEARAGMGNLWPPPPTGLAPSCRLPRTLAWRCPLHAPHWALAQVPLDWGLCAARSQRWRNQGCQVSDRVQLPGVPALAPQGTSGISALCSQFVPRLQTRAEGGEGKETPHPRPGLRGEGGDKKAGGLPGLGSRWVTRKQGWTQRPCVLHRRALPGGAASWEGEAIPPAAHEPGERPASGAALGWWEMGSSSAAHAGWPAASAPRALCLELSWLLPPRVCVLSTW